MERLNTAGPEMNLAPPPPSPTAVETPAGDERPAYGRLADALIDRVQLGIEFQLPLPAALHRDALIEALCGLPGGRHRAAGGIVTLRDCVLPAGAGPGVIAQARIVVPADGEQLTIRGDSHIIFNLNRALRDVLDAPSPVALDGARNLVGCRGDYRPHLGTQLRLAEAAVDALVALIAGAAGLSAGEVSGRVWVQQAEVCRDHRCEHAESLVSTLADMPVPGARVTRLRNINTVCIAWHGGARASAERKIYAKCDDLVRAEVAFRSRHAVRGILRGGDGPAASAGPMTLGQRATLELAAIARGAVPLLEEIERFADTAAVEPAAGSELVLCMAPLAILGCDAPRGGAGRPRRPETAALARRALDLLLREGAFDARGLHSSNTVLGALKAMRASGTLVAGAGARRVFTLAPRFENARQALRRARQRAPPDDE